MTDLSLSVLACLGGYRDGVDNVDDVVGVDG